MRKDQKRRLALSTLGISLFLVLLLASLSIWFLNRPEALHFIMKGVNSRSEWKINVEKMHFNPLKRKLQLQGIVLSDPKAQRSVNIGSIDVKISFLHLLRGKLIVRNIDIDAIDLSLPPRREKTKKSPRSLDIQKLFFLQNVSIERAGLGKLRIAFGEKGLLLVNEIVLRFDRTILGKSNVAIESGPFSVTARDRIVASVDQLSVEAATEFEHWSSRFPYIDDLTGKLLLKMGVVEGTPIDLLSAELRYHDDILSLKPLHASISGNTLEGTIEANFDEETFDVSINIPAPIAIPHLIKASKVLDTGGAISGNLSLSGRGMLPSESQGDGTVQLKYRFNRSPDYDNSIQTDVRWEKGKIQFQNALLTSGEATATLWGTIDVNEKKVELEGEGKAFPLHHLFEIFSDVHLKKIYGLVDFHGALNGWGKKFSARVEGVVREGGWKPISVEEVNALFEATYDKLSITGTIHQQGKERGSAAFEMLYGAKTKAGYRKKNLNLKGKLENYALGASLGKLAGLTGIATGTIELSGPHTDFHGTAELQATNGSWYLIPYSSLSTSIDLTKKRLTFDNIMLKLPRLEEQRFSESIVLDIQAGGIRIHGKPFPELSLDLARQNATATWLITSILYHNTDTSTEHVEAKGRISPEGGIDLSIQGQSDLTLLAPLSTLFREASGPAAIDLKISGKTTDPLFKGTLELNKVRFSPRSYRILFEDLVGTFRFDGRHIFFDAMRAVVQDGNITIDGSIALQGLRVASANLNVRGNTLPFRASDGSARIEFDGDLTLAGAFPNPLLSGEINIINGRYTKDFLLIEALKEKEKPVRTEQDEASDLFNPRLDLQIRNSGDFFIKNNIGEIGLSINIAATGTRASPKISGTVDADEGEIRYLGLKFDLTKGFIEFRDPYATPYLEVSGQKEVGVYNVTVFLHGPTENLALDLSATSPSGPLEKRDVISLIAYGIPERERERSTSLQQGQLTAQIIASQVTTVIERPVSEFAHLDVFRLEASNPSTQSISRVYIGKHISDRLAIDFSTDINTEEAIQTLTTEYLITDNILLRGLRSTGQRYGLRGTLRFRSR